MKRGDAQTQDVEFTPGIRQDWDPVRAPRGALADAVNVRLGRQGGIRPRRGTRTIAPTSSSTAHVVQNAPEPVGVVGSIGDAGVVGVAGKLFAYDSTRQRLDYCGRYSTARPVRKRLALTNSAGFTSFGRSRYAIAVNAAGYVLVAACDATRMVYTVESPEGVRVLVGGDSGPLTAPSCAAVAVGNTFYLVTQSLVTLSVRAITAASGAVTAGAPATVGTLAASNAGWDVTPAADGTHWYLVHQNSSTTLRVDRFAATVSNANQSITGLTGQCPASIYADSTDVWVGWHNDPTISGQVRYRTLATTLASFRSAVTTIATGLLYGPPLFGSSGTAGMATYVFQHANWSTGSGVSPYTVSTRWGTATSPNNSASAGTVTGPTVSWHGLPLSKPDSRQRVWMVFANYASNWAFQRFALVRLDIAPTAASRVDPTVELVYPQTEKIDSGPVASPTYFHHVAEHSGSHFFALPQPLQAGISSASGALLGIEVIEYVPSSVAPHRQLVETGLSGIVTGQPVEFWGSCYPLRDNGSGTLQQAQSIGGAEVGFLYPPAVLTATETAGGSLAAGGNYRWIFLFEWPDAYGRRHRSAPSAVHEIAALGGGNQSVSFSVTSCGYTQRHSSVDPGFRVQLVAYRTVTGGSTFYRETEPGASPSAYDVSTGQIAITSTKADADIRDGERAYTDGGVQQYDIAPSCIFSCESEDRVWLGGLWDGTIIQASLTRVPGEPTQFTDHESHQVVLPDPCTGLAYLDGAVVAFARRAIYAITGDGPNDQGVGAFSTPRAICRDIGCVDYRSILETAQGVLFKGARGFYLLPRGLGQPIFIGAAVQRFTSAIGSGYATVLGAAAVSDSETRTARFLVSTGSAEMVLSYDLDIAVTDPLMGWTRDTYAQRLAGIGAWPSGLALVKRDLSSATHLAYLDEATPTYTVDASNTEAITTYLETAQLRPAGLVGWWQCSCVGVALSDSDGGSLTVTVTTDSDRDGASTNQTATTWLMPSTPAYHYRFVHPQQGHCTLATVALSCVRGASAPALGPTYHGLTIEQAPLGMRRSQENDR